VIRWIIFADKIAKNRMKNNTLFMDNYTKNNDTVDEHVFVLEYVNLANYFFVIEAILIVPMLFGNSLILFSIARFRRLRTRMNILVANLSVSDFLVGLIIIPYDISFVMVEDLCQNIARNFSDSVFGIICAESTSDFCRTLFCHNVSTSTRTQNK
jgi:hypothetical protein